MNRALALIALAAGCAVAQADVAPAVGVYNFKQFRALQQDGSRVAVKADSGAAVAGALAAIGIDPRAAEASVAPGYYLVSLPAADAAAARAAVTALAAQPAIQYASPVFIDDFGGPMWPAPAIMVGFAQGADRAALAAAHNTADFGLPFWESFPDMDYQDLALRDGYAVINLANSLALDNRTTFAEPAMYFTGKSDFLPNDTFFPQLWGIHNTGQSGGNPIADMNGPEAWDIASGAGIRCQIIDVGVDLGHADLRLGGAHADFTGQGGGGNPVNACDQHGTAVAGCVSAIMNNSLGVAGIAHGAESQSARTFISNVPCNGGWTSNAAWTVNTLNQAQASGCRVTNNSNGYGFTAAAIDTAYINTRNAGLVHFASAGNSGAGVIGYPASIGVVNAVAAMDRFNNRAGFSQFGVGLDFSAPGVDVISTDQTGAAGYVAGDYVNVNGTSFASPYSAGVACLVLSRNAGLTAAQVENIMASTCKPLGVAGYDTDFGWGFVNAYAAVLATPTAAPSNDGCASAVALPYGFQFGGGILTNATSDGPGALCGSSSGQPDVWYKVTAPCAGFYRLIVQTCGTNDRNGIDSGMDTVVSLHSSCTASYSFCNDDNIGECGTSDQGLRRDSYIDAPLALAAGETVFIRVSRFSTGTAGYFNINSLFEYYNDRCASPLPIFDGVTNACNIGALTDGPTEANCSFCCGDLQVNGDLWYTYTAPVTGTVTVDTCDGAATFDTKLAAYTGCPGGPNSAIACNDDACLGTRSNINFPITAGNTYYIRFGGFSTARGSANIRITSVPANCDGDFNCDGNVNQDDVDCLINEVAGNPCVCLDPDFNGDGNTNQDDVDALINVVAGGACP